MRKNRFSDNGVSPRHIKIVKFHEKSLEIKLPFKNTVLRSEFSAPETKSLDKKYSIISFNLFDGYKKF